MGEQKHGTELHRRENSWRRGTKLLSSGLPLFTSLFLRAPGARVEALPSTFCLLAFSHGMLSFLYE